MSSKVLKTLVVFFTFVSFGAWSCHAQLVTSFIEDFESGDANWRGPAPDGSNMLVAVGSGGPDGSSFVSTDFNFEFFPDGSGMGGSQPTPTLFRGQDEFNSSDGAFEGNWIASGVENFSFFFRHNLPVPTTVFARFSTADNFPGAAGIEFIPALPNQWTEVSIDINPTNPQLVYEGPASTFGSVFSNVGHLQVGLSVPVGFGGTTTNYTFDLDKISVSTVPEPAAGLLLTCLGAGFCVRRKRG